METWMNQTWWLYDLTVLAILILCIWGGWRRGILHTAISFVSYLLAMLLANAAAEPIAETIYDRFLSSVCTQWLEEELESNSFAQTIQSTLAAYGIQLDDSQLQQLAENPDSATEQLCAAAGISEDVLEQYILPSLDSAAALSYIGLPEWMTNALLAEDETTSTQANQLISTAAVLLSEDTVGAAESLTETYIKPVVVSFLKILVFFLTFLLISAAMQVIIKLLSRASRGSFISFNQILGAIFGCCQALLFLILMKTLTAWLVESGSGQLAFFNETVIEKTILFQILYSL